MSYNQIMLSYCGRLPLAVWTEIVGPCFEQHGTVVEAIHMAGV